MTTKENNMTKEEKLRFQLWMKKSTHELVNRMMKEDNCLSKSEFIEKAILFYCGYLSAESNENYLPNIVVSTLKSIVRESDNRQNRNLFKIAVELSMMVKLFGSLRNFDEFDLEKLRGKCVKEVKKLNGFIEMEHAGEWQE